MAHSSFSTSGCFLRRVGAFLKGDGFARPACSANAISWSMSSSWPPQALSTKASQRLGFISLGSSFMDDRDPRLRGTRCVDAHVIATTASRPCGLRKIFFSKLKFGK